MSLDILGPFIFYALNMQEKSKSPSLVLGVSFKKPWESHCHFLIIHVRSLLENSNIQKNITPLLTIILRCHFDNSKNQRHGVVATDSFAISTQNIYLANLSWPSSIKIIRGHDNGEQLLLNPWDFFVCCIFFWFPRDFITF